MKKDMTKKLLAQSLKELSRTRQLEKISIREICECCECNHSTFYYHFADKDDLIEWIIRTDIEDHFTRVDTQVWTNNTYHLLCVFQKDCEFYRQCLQLNTYNSLRKLISDVNRRAVSEFLNNHTGSEVISDEAREFFITFWSAAFTETNIRYIMDGAKTDPKKMLQYYYNFSEPALGNVIRNFIETAHSEGMEPIKEGE